MEGSQTYNIQPDIVIASKCITSGFFPLGAVILGERMTQQMMDASYEAEEFFHGFTAGGHPVGCAIALKAIDVINKKPTGIVISPGPKTPDDAGISIELIKRASKKIPILKAGNMSLGVNLLMYLTEIASKSLGDNYLSKIFEIHHKHKKDYL